MIVDTGIMTLLNYWKHLSELFGQLGVRKFDILDKIRILNMTLVNPSQQSPERNIGQDYFQHYRYFLNMYLPDELLTMCTSRYLIVDIV